MARGERKCCFSEDKPVPELGKPFQLLQAIRLRSDVQLYSSAVLLEKLADVLTRPSATKRLALIGKTVPDVLADYVEAVELVEPTIVPAWCSAMPMMITSSPLQSRPAQR